MSLAEQIHVGTSTLKRMTDWPCAYCRKEFADGAKTRVEPIEDAPGTFRVIHQRPCTGFPQVPLGRAAYIQSPLVASHPGGRA